MSDTLYHATRYENAGDIVVTGLEPRGMEQGTYFANKPEYAAGFLRLYGAKNIVVFAVSVDDLDESLLEPGVDHNPTFFPDDLEVTLYRGHIDPELLGEDVIQFDLRDD